MMGEDPHLAGALGAATVRGLTDGGALANASAAVAPLLKHFAAYSCPEGGHNAAPAHVGRRELLTTFLPPFAEAMDAGAQAVMASYNEIDGEVNAASKFLLSVLPSGHWRGHGPRDGPFDGFVSSDFGESESL
jgi:beta-glucosidase